MKHSAVVVGAVGLVNPVSGDLHGHNDAVRGRLSAQRTWIQ